MLLHTRRTNIRKSALEAQNAITAAFKTQVLTKHVDELEKTGAWYKKIWSFVKNARPLDSEIDPVELADFRREWRNLMLLLKD